MNTSNIGFLLLEPLAPWAADFAGWVWGLPLLFLLVGTHLLLTIRLGVIQRYIPRAIRISFTRTKDEGKSEGEGDVSQFGSLMTALAATIGTGNIIGVAGAIVAGGPGAVFWMWITGVFGIATKYSEAVLAVKYRVKMPNGTMAGGPMYVLEHGMGMKWLGQIFAVLTMIAGLGIGCMTQANSIVGNVQSLVAKDQPQMVAWGVGLLLSGLTAVVILGGIRSITRVCEFLVPIMALIYITGCVLILGRNFSVLGDSISLIWNSAFTGHAAIGGFIGVGTREAMRFGVARGLFSNEAGLGSAPIVAAAARTRNPIRQALVSSTGTFWDTVVVCALTGLTIVSSGHWTEGLDRTQLTQAAFGDLHAIGPAVLTIALLTFVFSTILGWSYYGEIAAEYLFGLRAIKPYRILWVIAVLVGSVLPLQIVWDFSDAANGLMAVPNLISLVALSGVIVAETRKYQEELTGESPVPPNAQSGSSAALRK